MASLTPTARLLLAAALAVEAAAQPVYIVDEKGGPGSHFTDIPQALAAVPDGSALRVRAGSYSAFVVSKGVAIVGDQGVWVGKGSPPLGFAVVGTTPSQRVLLKNLLVMATTVGSFAILSAQGNVAIENLDFNLPSYVAASPSVQLHSVISSFGNGPLLTVIDSTIQLGASLLRPFSAGTEPTLVLVRSRCVAVATAIAGASGYLGCGSKPAGPGSLALSMDQSTFISLGATVVGGAGGVCMPLSGCGGCSYGAGGDGMLLVTGSFATFHGAAPLGGGGWPAGVPYRAWASTVIVDTAATPSGAFLSGVPSPGQVVRFDCKGTPSSLAVLILAYDPTLVPVDPVTPGSLLANYAVALGPRTLSTGGLLSLPLTIPATWPLGQTYFGQFVTMEPVPAKLWVTNSFPIHIQ